MANIFNEVDEDIRKERYQNLWSKYGKYVIGFLFLIVISFSFSQYYQSKKISDSKKILDIYFLAMENVEKNQLDLAMQNLEIIYAKKNKILAAISGLKLSETYLKNNQKEKALLILKNVYNNDSIDSIYRELALYKYIIINFENTDVQSIEDMVKSIKVKILVSYFQEMIGIKYLTLNNIKEANSIFTNLSLDINTPLDLRIRLDKLIQIAS